MHSLANSKAISSKSALLPVAATRRTEGSILPTPSLLKRQSQLVCGDGEAFRSTLAATCTGETQSLGFEVMNGVSDVAQPQYSAPPPTLRALLVVTNKSILNCYSIHFCW